VFGIDVHPVAVALARVTYLLAIGGARLQAARDPFTVPVYLGDSMQYSQSEGLFGVGALVIEASDAHELFARELRFPDGVLEDVQRFDLPLAELTRRATDRVAGSAVPNITAVYERLGVAAQDRSALDSTFESPVPAPR
jgi:hypothetical protein